MIVPLHLPLAALPTPLQHRPDLGAVLGRKAFWVKRDDLTGYSWGGNKVRTIEYLLGDAKAQSCDNGHALRRPDIEFRGADDDRMHRAWSGDCPGQLWNRTPPEARGARGRRGGRRYDPLYRMRRSGLLIDTTYNGKALRWLRDQLPQTDRSILYWHTGGALAVADRLGSPRHPSPYHQETK